MRCTHYSPTTRAVLLLMLTSLFPSVSIAKTQQPQHVLVIEYAQREADSNLPISSVIPTLFAEHSEFKVEHISASYTRAVTLLKKLDNVCLSNMIRTQQRQQMGYFSQYPVKIFPNMGLFIDPKYDVSVAQTSINRAVDLAALLTHYPHLTLQIEYGRSYGPLEKTLRLPRFQQQIKMLKGTELTERTIKMFLLKRTDAILAYPNVVEFVRSQQGIASELKSYPLNGLPEVTLGYMLCSRSPLGKQLITTINHQLVKLSKTKAFLNRQISGYDQNTVKTIKKHYNRIFHLAVGSP